MDNRRIIAIATLVAVAVTAAWALSRPGSSIQDESIQDESAREQQAPEEPAEDESAQAEPAADGAAPLPVLDQRPDLVEVDGWLQSDYDSLDDLDGTVYAVQFWTFGCFNCKNTLPHLQELYAKYQDQGFEIVGIHSPEFDREADVANIEAAIDDLGVTWPVVLDTNKRTFHAWQPGRAFWPRLYLIDRDGNVRYDHVGEGAYDEIDAAVAALLAEPGA